MLALQAIAVLNFGTTPTSTPSILPTGSFVLAGVVVPIGQLYLAGIVIVAAAVLAAVYRYTRFGLATRAGAENDVGAALIGLSANRIAAQNWVIATVLAALSGILIAPISTSTRRPTRCSSCPRWASRWSAASPRSRSRPRPGWRSA